MHLGSGAIFASLRTKRKKWRRQRICIWSCCMVAPEFLRLRTAGKLKQTLVSADFLALHHFSMAQFVQMLAHVHIALHRLAGAPDDPMLKQFVQRHRINERLSLLPSAHRGFVFDGLTTSQLQTYFFPVEAVPVLGNTNGCGDAFISYFLAEYWQSHNLAAASFLENRWRAGDRVAFALPTAAYPHPDPSPRNGKAYFGRETAHISPLLNDALPVQERVPKLINHRYRQFYEWGNYMVVPATTTCRLLIQTCCAN